MEEVKIVVKAINGKENFYILEKTKTILDLKKVIASQNKIDVATIKLIGPNEPQHDDTTELSKLSSPTLHIIISNREENKKNKALWIGLSIIGAMALYIAFIIFI